jgi:hypothetical protein
LSAFLPWLVLNAKAFSFSFSLVNLMNVQESIPSLSQFFQLFGGLFLFGSLALLIWRKAFWVQLASLSILSFPVMAALVKFTGDGNLTLDRLTVLLGSIGAGAALECLATAIALRDGILPPTANFNEPDPQCDLDVIPNQARRAEVEYALSNSFAFGGLNAVLAFRRYA